MPDKQIFKNLGLLLLALSILLIGYMTERSETFTLLSLFSVSFAAYTLLIHQKKSLSIKEILFLGVGFRLLLFGSVPVLSDDFYRFIWDGMLNANGYSPYLFKPAEFIGIVNDFSKELLSKMNSPEYHSVYPPVMQLIFTACYYLGGENVFLNLLFLRGFAVLAETVTLWCLAKILALLNMKASNMVFYAFNPLVLIELTGNLHTETFMITLLALTFLGLMKSKNLWSAVGLSFAFLSKLWPVMFLPFFIKHLGMKRSVVFTLIFITLSGAVIFLFIDIHDLDAMSQGLDLYFRKFEFNASFYNIARWLGWQYYGYNAIHVIGPLLAGIAILLVIGLFFKQKKSWKSFFETILFAATVHLLLSTTVHPWYVIPLVFYGVLANSFKFPIVWSGLILLSYIHYGAVDWLQNWIVWFEYGILFAVVYMDWKRLRIQPV